MHASRWLSHFIHPIHPITSQPRLNRTNIPSITQGGYGFYKGSELRKALVWDKDRWVNHTNKQRFPPVKSK